MLKRAGAAAMIAAAVVLSGGGSVAAAPGAPGGERAGAESRASGAGTGPATARISTVTLLTGDRAVLTQRPDGSRAVSVLPGAGRESIPVTRYADGDRLYVIPSDVAHLVGDRLDAALFDVVGLVEAGYDDASRDTLPVIVQAAGAPTPSLRAQAAPDWEAAGLSPDRVLESVGAVADDLPKGRAADLLDALATGAAPSARTLSSPGDGLRVWLDAPVRTLDADSTPQIGAPAAWAAGLTGEGVTVAVLDTGIDATHPDLGGSVVGEADFTESGGVTDGHGHGTHVASILAGSGEASDGANRGVAPDADLLVGKVLDDGGFGEMSWIIDGMEWAAESGADVVNMSVGSHYYTDGTDPGALALNALSAQYGTLFVVGAGNDYGYETVGTPGSATSALTVGAVDDDDQVTDFSSRGPRAGDHAIKPDVTAPGQGIVAARAAGTAMGDVVDDRYTAASGTSMATPHVAGAAAVLKQARPELTGDQLKSLLMASAHPTGGTVWDEGAGRIDLAAAMVTQVTATPASLSVGLLEYPQETVTSSTVAYTNPTGGDLTVDLTADVVGPDGEPHEDAVTVSPEHLTVPAGGAATAEVTVHPVPGAVGRYSGAVVASASDGTSVRTALGWYKEPAHFDLTVRALGTDGDALAGSTHALVQAVDGGSFGTHIDLTGGEAVTLRVPEGTYSVAGQLMTHTGDFVASSLVTAIEPEVAVSSDTTVLLDARRAHPVTVRTHRPAAVQQYDTFLTRTNGLGTLAMGLGTTLHQDIPVSVTPSPRPTHGDIQLDTAVWLDGPPSDDGAPAYTYDLTHHQTGAVSAPEIVGDASTTAAITTSYHELGPDLTPVVSRVGLAPEQYFAAALWRTVPTPLTRVEYVTGGDVQWTTSTMISADPDSPVGGFRGTPSTYEPGGRYTESQYRAVVTVGHEDAVAVAEGPRLFVRPHLIDGDGRAYSRFSNEAASPRLRIWQNGRLTVDTAASDYPGASDGVAGVDMPTQKTHYRVAHDAARETPYWALSTQVSTEWEFEAAPVGAEDFAVLPLLDVSYDVKGLDLHNAAPRRTCVTLTVDHPTNTEGTVEGARLWWSADDGTTWHPARLTRDDENTFTATVTAPRGTEHVSLKVEAWDEAGSTMKQSIVRAYGIS